MKADHATRQTTATKKISCRRLMIAFVPLFTNQRGNGLFTTLYDSLKFRKSQFHSDFYSTGWWKNLFLIGTYLFRLNCPIEAPCIMVGSQHLGPSSVEMGNWNVHTRARFMLFSKLASLPRHSYYWPFGEGREKNHAKKQFFLLKEAAAR